MKLRRHFQPRAIPPKAIRQRLFWLVRSPLFWWITFWGNFCILSGAGFFHWLEAGVNPNVQSFFDSLSWTVGMVTTVGGGNIHPVTTAGKIFSIFMMMGGAVFLWSYMAMFVGILVDPELSTIQHELEEMHKAAQQAAPGNATGL